MSTPPKDLDLSLLSADYRAAFEAQQDQIAALAEHNKRLENLVKELQRALYGKKSERLSADERQLCFEDLETAVAEVEEAKEEAGATPSASRA